MRTAGQGQAAVPGERVRRRRKDGLPGPPVLGRGRRSHGLSREWSAIQRSPVPIGGFRFCHGARFAYHGFLFARTGSARPQNTQEGKI